MQTKPSFTSLLLIFSVALLMGCAGFKWGRSTPPYPPHEPAEAATLAEIDAAAGLDFDPSRLEALTRIARRPNLSPAAQVHLANSAYKCLSFGNSKLTLLRALIANPAFCDSAHHAIVTQLGSLDFDAQRQQILRDLDRWQQRGFPPEKR